MAVEAEEKQWAIGERGSLQVGSTSEAITLLARLAIPAHDDRPRFGMYPKQHGLEVHAIEISHVHKLHTLILRFRHVRHPVFVLRLTSFLCLPPDSILFGSPGSW